MALQATSSQTVGPYYSIGMSPLYCSEIAGSGVDGERVHVEGAIHDGRNTPVSDALIEVWQADATGRYAHRADDQPVRPASGFSGFGRIPTDNQGRFAFTTIKPGRVPMPDGRLQAPHLVIGVTMRGLLKTAATRMYFADDDTLAEDPILSLVPTERRATLIAQRSAGAGFEWDIHMQGPKETVFFHY